MKGLAMTQELLAKIAAWMEQPLPPPPVAPEQVRAEIDALLQPEVKEAA